MLALGRTIAVDSAARRRAVAAPSASAERSIRLAGNWIPASSASRSAAVANGTAAAARAVIRRSPGDSDTGDAELVVARHDPAPAHSAVVVGAAQFDRAQHGLDRLAPVADEPGAMPGPAVDPGPAMPGVGGQQPAQQRSAELSHRGTDRQLHRRQALAGRTQRPGRQLGQPVYLGRELRRDLIVEPPFRPPSRPGAPWRRPCLAGGPRRSPR